MSAPSIARAVDSSSSATANNLPPVSSAVSIDSGAGSITLTENTTKNVIVTSTVTDLNGCTEISSVAVKFFRSNIAASTDLVPSAYANNGSGLVRVTVGSLGSPAIVTNNFVDIAGTTGSVYVGQWKVTVISTTEIDLQGSTYTTNPGDGSVTPNAAKNGAMASDNANYHYTQAATVDALSCTGVTDTIATYTATIPVYYYAEPTDTGTYSATDWSAEVTPVDGGGAGTAGTNDTIEMATLTALNVSATIPYGTMNLGATTGATNTTATVTNTGNKDIGTQVDGYGTINGDGLSMTCVAGTITVGNEKYGTTDVTYTSLTGTLTDTAATVSGFTVNKATSGTPSTGPLYWGFAMPSTGVNGVCGGKVVFTAI
jgi:hypothetical protein